MAEKIAFVAGSVSQVDETIDYGQEPTITGRKCNMVKGCKNDAVFTAVDNSPEARTDKGEAAVYDACEEHAGKVWRLGLQVIPINAHVPG
jgi:hypothetical protein